MSLFWAFVLATLAIIAVDRLLSFRYRQRTDAEDQERYIREMHYLESLIYHVAYREGRVSQRRIFELIPDAAACSMCRKQIALVFEYGLIKRELLLDTQTGDAVITEHVRRTIARADEFAHLGRAWILPARKIQFTHRACHIFSV